MKLFDASATCPKCKHDVVRTHYCNGKNTYYGSPCYGQTSASEHLHRYCDRCGYAWLERCVSSATADEIAAMAAAQPKEADRDA